MAEVDDGVLGFGEGCACSSPCQHRLSVQPRFSASPTKRCRSDQGAFLPNNDGRRGAILSGVPLPPNTASLPFDDGVLESEKELEELGEELELGCRWCRAGIGTAEEEEDMVAVAVEACESIWLVRIGGRYSGRNVVGCLGRQPVPCSRWSTHTYSRLVDMESDVTRTLSALGLGRFLPSRGPGV